MVSPSTSPPWIAATVVVVSASMSVSSAKSWLSRRRMSAPLIACCQSADSSGCLAVP